MTNPVALTYQSDRSSRGLDSTDHRLARVAAMSTAVGGTLLLTLAIANFLQFNTEASSFAPSMGATGFSGNDRRDLFELVLHLAKQVISVLFALFAILAAVWGRRANRSPGLVLAAAIGLGLWNLIANVVPVMELLGGLPKGIGRPVGLVEEWLQANYTRFVWLLAPAAAVCLLSLHTVRSCLGNPDVEPAQGSSGRTAMRSLAPVLLFVLVFRFAACDARQLLELIGVWESSLVDIYESPWLIAAWLIRQIGALVVPILLLGLILSFTRLTWWASLIRWPAIVLAVVMIVGSMVDLFDTRARYAVIGAGVGLTMPPYAYVFLGVRAIAELYLPTLLIAFAWSARARGAVPNPGGEAGGPSSAPPLLTPR